MKGFLEETQRLDLMSRHRHERERRFADKIKSVLLIDKGWSYEQVAEVLLLDDSTVRNYLTQFTSGGVDSLLKDYFVGKVSKLSLEEEVNLVTHLTEQLYSTTKEVVAYVEERFGIHYKVGGMLHLLHRLGFSYKKTKLIPGKADAEKQQEFLERYEQLKNGLKPKDKVYFMDGVHPRHTPIASYGWIPTGTEGEIRSNTGRLRININGALNVEDMELIFRTDDSINSQSTVKLFQQIESKNPDAENIFVIADNARYYRSIIVQEYLKTSRIQILFLPSYAPNLNLIERLWKFFKKNILYNRYFETFQLFKEKSIQFLENISDYSQQLENLLTENFHIIGAKSSES
jgi:transposase